MLNFIVAVSIMWFCFLTFFRILERFSILNHYYGCGIVKQFYTVEYRSLCSIHSWKIVEYRNLPPIVSRGAWIGCHYISGISWIAERDSLWISWTIEEAIAVQLCGQSKGPSPPDFLGNRRGHHCQISWVAEENMVTKLWVTGENIITELYN